MFHGQTTLNPGKPTEATISLLALINGPGKVAGHNVNQQQQCFQISAMKCLRRKLRKQPFYNSIKNTEEYL